MINEFLEKTLIYEADTSSGERVQEMELYLNFIGRFGVPPQELTEEEERQQMLIKRRRASQRSYNARKKLKQQEQGI